MSDRTIQYMPIAELPSAARNPKSHSDEMVGSVTRFGFVEPMTLDERTGRLVSGHGRRDELLRRQAAGEAPPDGIVLGDDGVWLAPVTRGWSSRSDEEAEAFVIAANRIGERGGWHQDMLADVLADLSKLDGGLVGIGYDDGDLSELLNGLRLDPDLPPRRDHKAVEKRRESALSALGDVWLLGRHRLMCGDAFDPGARDALLVGQRIDAIFTDPPYGMNVETDFSKMHSGHGGGVYEPVAGDDRPFDPTLLVEAFREVPEQFWWGADYYRDVIPMGGSWVVWDKRGVDGEGIYDDVIGNHFELCWSRRAHRREIARVTWSGHNGLQQEDTSTRIHPTQKPAALVEWFMERWMKSGWVVVDLFAGSGSTLIACERRQMTACVMELSPAYVDSICERWQHFSGKMPINAATREAVDFLAES